MGEANESKDTVELHTFMQDRRTLFCYSGPLTEDLLTTISNPVLSLIHI